jgi:hypothetical protein
MSNNANIAGVSFYRTKAMTEEVTTPHHGEVGWMLVDGEVGLGPQEFVFVVSKPGENLGSGWVQIHVYRGAVQQQKILRARFYALNPNMLAAKIYSKKNRKKVYGGIAGWHSC